MFLGKILVTYHNTNLRDTYGKDGVSPKEWKIIDSNGNTRTYETETLGGNVVVEIRERQVSNIDILLG